MDTAVYKDKLFKACLGYFKGTLVCWLEGASSTQFHLQHMGTVIS